MLELSKAYLDEFLIFTDMTFILYGSTTLQPPIPPYG
jgi:hypothetical protein